MTLLNDAAFAGIRSALEITLTMTCTLTPMVAGAPDGENNVAYAPGTPVTNAPCRFEAISRAVRDEGGVTLINVPTLSVSATQAIAVGTRVSAVTDQLGGTPPGASGAFVVERVLDDTAGLGAAILPVYELRGADVVVS